MVQDEIEKIMLIKDKYYIITWEYKHRQCSEEMMYQKRSLNLYYFKDRSGDWLIVHFKDIVSIHP